MQTFRPIFFLIIILGTGLFFGYPHLALNYEYVPFNTLTDNYNRLYEGDYYHDYIMENQHKFKKVIDHYYANHNRYPKNVTELHQDALKHHYWIQLKNPFLRPQSDNPQDFVVDYICCELDKKYEGRLLLDLSSSDNYKLYAAHQYGALVKEKGSDYWLSRDP